MKLDALDIHSDEVTARKDFLEFGDEDVEALVAVHEMAQTYADPVIEDFYQHLLSFPQGRSFFQDPAVLSRVKQAQRNYFLDLTRGEYGPEYVRNRLRIGAVHQRIGLPFQIYLGMYNWYLRTVANHFFEANSKNPAQALKLLLSLTKLVFFDIGLAMEVYLRTIEEQQEAIKELSTPVLQLREGLLILPIVGALNSARARQLTEQLLRAIASRRAKMVVMDVTGVPAVDSKVANHLVQTVAASRLMGATVIVTGLSPEVAQALVAIGVDLSSVKTAGDLQSGIEEAEFLLGYRVVRAEAS